MTEIKIYTPETIEDNPLPQEGEASLATTDSSSGDIHSPTEIKDQPLPVKRMSHELIGSVLNTQSRKILAEFEFTEMGAIQIGKYTTGISGDIKISPSGIVGRNLSGITTFSIDGDTGNATFLGTIQAGSVIADSVLTDYLQVGEAASDVNDGVTTISGGKITTNSMDANRISASNIDVAVDVGTGAGSAYVRLDGGNNRIVIHDGTNPRIVIGNV